MAGALVFRFAATVGPATGRLTEFGATEAELGGGATAARPAFTAAEGASAATGDGWAMTLDIPSTTISTLSSGLFLIK